MQLVAMDIVGPFPESQAGNTHVLVVADYFTRWTEAYAIQNQEAATVARELVDEFCPLLASRPTSFGSRAKFLSQRPSQKCASSSE